MDIRETIKNRLFWIVSILLSVIVFVSAFQASKIFQGQTTVLFLPKTDLTARNINQIIANAEQFSRKEKIEVERLGKSGMLELAVFGKTQSKTESSSRQATRELLDTMSKYYNIKTDLDMRIVGGPIIVQTARLNVGLWIFLSLFLGFAVGFLGSLFFILLSQDGLEKIKEFAFEKPKDFSLAPVELPKVSFSETRVEKKDNLARVRNIFNFNAEEEVAIIQPKKENPVVEKKAAAPANLPIAEEEFAFNLPVENVSPVEAVSEKIAEAKSAEALVAEAAAVDMTREASPEEVKARLNKLLSGDMLK